MLLFPCTEHKNLFAKDSCCYSIPTASCSVSQFLLFSRTKQIMTVLIVNSTQRRITQEESINEEFSRTGMSLGDCLKILIDMRNLLIVCGTIPKVWVQHKTKKERRIHVFIPLLPLTADIMSVDASMFAALASHWCWSVTWA